MMKSKGFIMIANLGSSRSPESNALTGSTIITCRIPIRLFHLFICPLVSMHAHFEITQGSEVDPNPQGMDLKSQGRLEKI